MDRFIYVVCLALIAGWLVCMLIDNFRRKWDLKVPPPDRSARTFGPEDGA